MDSKICESNIFGKKCKEQIDNLLQSENYLRLQFEHLKEENATLKINSNKYGIIN